jgi:hypothetical protein
MSFKDIKEYAGEQVIISSNRLVFNARKDSILISSNQYINLSAGDKVTIDVGTVDSDSEQNMLLVNAPKIQFGLDSKGKTVEPVAKADALEEVLNDLMDVLEEYSRMVVVSVPPFAPGLITAQVYLTTNFTSIKADLSEIGNVKSDTTFTI